MIFICHFGKFYLSINHGDIIKTLKAIRYTNLLTGKLQNYILRSTFRFIWLAALI
jgi:hypothetical protein